MKKQTNRTFSRICICIGFGLLVLAAAAVLFWQWSIQAAQKNAAAYVQTIHTLIPEPQGAALEERRDNTMSALSIDGTNFIGILEIPKYGSALPVCADWGEISQYPCCFSGSVYDRTMQIGGTSQKGQYDFYREISVGDAVFFTDMEGNRFAYEITDIRYEKHGNQTALQQEAAALTLSVKNIYAFEHIIISCNIMDSFAPVL